LRYHLITELGTKAQGMVSSKYGVWKGPSGAFSSESPSLSERNKCTDMRGGSRELWRWMNCWQRLDVIALALKIVHVAVVFLYVSHRYRLAFHEQASDANRSEFLRGRRKLVADLASARCRFEEYDWIAVLCVL
jgi:hypothetical protein